MKLGRDDSFSLRLSLMEDVAHGTNRTLLDKPHPFSKTLHCYVFTAKQLASFSE